MSKLRHIAMQVPDLEKAAEFYQSVFEMERVHEAISPVGNAISLDGKNDYIDVGDFEWGGACSFSGWVRYEQKFKANFMAKQCRCSSKREGRCSY